MTQPPRNRRQEAREHNLAQGLTTRVLRLRLKDKHAPLLRAEATRVNLVWNYVNALSAQVLLREGRFISSDELHRFTAGATREGLDLHSQTVQAVNEEFTTRRKQFKKARLRWRVSNRARSNYSLGWVPFKKSAISYRGGQLFFRGQALSLWDSYGLAGYELGTGSFSEDARGRWYVNLTVKVRKKPLPAAAVSADALGIDLGLKSHMTDSLGEAVQAQRFYRDLEPALAAAQRAGKKERVRALHAKVSNRRKDFLHKLSTQQARDSAAIFVGDVNSKALARTRMAKSVLDAGWSAYRTMLSYKCDDAGVWFKQVDESYSTQECHVCHARTGPKGREELSVRRWVCSGCGAEHDRDVNAALNIKARGLAWLEKEFSKAGEARAGEAVLNKSAGHSLSALAPGHGRPAGGIPFL